MWSPIKLDFLFYNFFNLLCFFKDSIKINIKEKKKNRCQLSLKLLRRSRNGFTSLRSLDGHFCCSERKNRFGPKLREIKITFPPINFRCSLPVHRIWAISSLRRTEGARANKEGHQPTSIWDHNLKKAH